VRGNIIYQGDAHAAVDYFAKLGFQLPMFENPSDFYMKLMNEEGVIIEKLKLDPTIEANEEEVKQEFNERV